jgi:nicotinate-nucleotide adenylyltransferase
MRVAAYPGSFDPPTVAHLAVAEAAFEQLDVDRVDLVISIDPLGKDGSRQVGITDRLAVLAAVAAARPWLGVATTERRLIADIAEGYAAVVMGADKWAQVLDPDWYEGSTAARDRALAALPAIGIAPRPTDDGPGAAPVLLPAGLRVVELDVHPSHRAVSATSVRSGRHEWMAPEAAAFAERTGAWTDPDRYARWVAE